MMIKGKEICYSVIIATILAIIAWIYPAIRLIAFIRFPNGKFSGFFLIVITIFLLALMFIMLRIILAFILSDWLDWWLNVKRKTIETREEIQDFPVVARFASHRHSLELFSVKIRLGEGTYHTFNDIEDYAATKEGDMVKVKVKLYIDAEGDAFYVKPLSIVRKCERVSEPLTAS